MKASKLSAVWDAPDNSRLMKKQTSVRIATHVEARIAALCEMFPSKTKSQIINDLLAAALDEVAEGFEFVPEKERQLDFDPDNKHEIEIAEDVGDRSTFVTLANRFFTEFEKELGVEQPKACLTVRWDEVR